MGLKLTELRRALTDAAVIIDSYAFHVNAGTDIEDATLTPDQRALIVTDLRAIEAKLDALRHGLFDAQRS